MNYCMICKEYFFCKYVYFVEKEKRPFSFIFYKYVLVSPCVNIKVKCLNEHKHMSVLMLATVGGEFVTVLGRN